MHCWRFRVHDMPLGGNATGTFRVPISLLSLGSVTVTAARSGSTPADPKPGNDTASAGCTVVSVLPGPLLTRSPTARHAESGAAGPFGSA